MGAIGDQADSAGDAAGKQEGDDAAKDGADKGRDPEGIESVAAHRVKVFDVLIVLEQFGIGDGLRVPHGCLVQGDHLVAQKLAGAGKVSRRAGLGEPFDLFLHQLEALELGVHLPKAGAEVVLGAAAGVGSAQRLYGFRGVCVGGGAIRPCGVLAQQHFSFLQAEKVGHVGTDLPQHQDARDPRASDAVDISLVWRIRTYATCEVRTMAPTSMPVLQPSLVPSFMVFFCGRVPGRCGSGYDGKGRVCRTRPPTHT